MKKSVLSQHEQGSAEQVVVRRKSYSDMTDAEIKIAARHIITSSSSEAEVQQRLRDELDYSYSVAICTTIPNDATGREAR